MKIFTTVALLIVSNIFMNLAWYGHLKFFGEKNNTALWLIILTSWGLALFEYCFQVPANRIGSMETGGPLSLMQLKVLQEVISLFTFIIVAVFLFKNMQIGINQIIGFLLLIAAVYFMFRK